MQRWEKEEGAEASDIPPKQTLTRVALQNCKIFARNRYLYPLQNEARTGLV